LCREKIPPLATLRGEISLSGVSVANVEEVKKFPSGATVRSEISPAGAGKKIPVGINCDEVKFPPQGAE